MTDFPKLSEISSVAIVRTDIRQWRHTTAPQKTNTRQMWVFFLQLTIYIAILANFLAYRIAEIEGTLKGAKPLFYTRHI